jgi:glycosyltransferase involved in cell wall biosynthesis
VTAAVHVVVPEGIGDPARPSGGNTYDRRVCRGLAHLGFAVHVHEIPGRWPERGETSCRALADVVSGLPDGAVVLVDGLVASPSPEVLVPERGRLRLVVLVHMPLGYDRTDDGSRQREAAVLSAAAAVVTTSAWARRALLELYSLPEERVRVARPGVDPSRLAPGTATAGALLSVATVSPAKGHDVLLDSLELLGDSRWRCVCVGSLGREPAFAEGVRHRVADGPLSRRVRFPGAQGGADLARCYGAADVLVHPSRAETYGMVITEALSRGLPVVAAEVGGVPEALGYGADGTRPGLLVPPGDPEALRDALQAWLEDAALRRRLRRAARERRASLTGWSTTAAVIAGVLAGAAR